jgi:hypothetical protein
VSVTLCDRDSSAQSSDNGAWDDALFEQAQIDIYDIMNQTVKVSVCSVFMRTYDCVRRC